METWDVTGQTDFHRQPKEKSVKILESTEKSRGLRGPVLSLPKDCLDFSLVNLRALRVLCGFFSKVNVWRCRFFVYRYTCLLKAYFYS